MYTYIYITCVRSIQPYSANLSGTNDALFGPLLHPCPPSLPIRTKALENTGI